jgi:hypothetical protein
MKKNARVCLLGLLLVMSLSASGQVIFFDDFGTVPGLPLAGHVPPGGGGVWSVERGSGATSNYRANIRAHILQDSANDDAQVRLTLATPITSSHQFQIRVVNYVPGAENVDIRAEDAPFNFTAWRVAFDRAVGLIVPRVNSGPFDPAFVTILPLSAMQPGDYTVTVREVDFASQSFTLDVTAMFNDGGGVSVTRSGLFFDPFPIITVSAVGAVAISVFEETVTDGALIDDVRFSGGMQPLVVAIDIKPGDDPNGVNLASKGLIAVGVLSSPTFAAPTEIQHATLRFGAAGGGSAPVKCHAEDLNADALLDLVCHFKALETGLQPGDTSAVLTGSTVAGAPLAGIGAVKVVPAKKAD